MESLPQQTHACLLSQVSQKVEYTTSISSIHSEKTFITERNIASKARCIYQDVAT